MSYLNPNMSRATIKRLPGFKQPSFKLPTRASKEFQDVYRDRKIKLVDKKQLIKPDKSKQFIGALRILK